MNTVKVDAKLQKAYDRAKIGLLQVKGSVFISTILFSLKFNWTDECPTACTDGLNLYVNPAFFEPLSPDERIFLLAHEAWHVAFQHMLRMNSTKKDNFNVWNQATDHYINIMLIDAGYKMIQGGLADHQYKDQKEWSSDKIFHHLMQNPGKQDSSFQPDFAPAGSESGGKDGDGKGGVDEADVQRKVEDAIIKASTAAKIKGEAGAIPGDIAVSIERLTNPKLPWNVILQNYMSSFDKEDFSWKKPNRRYQSQGLYLPSLFSESLGHIGAAVDTSCSVSNHQFSAFITELDDIMENNQPEKLSIIDCDTSIHKIYNLAKGDDLSDVTFHGRGGTALEPIFDHYNKEENKPLVLIVFSDLECREITEEPDYPVVWVKLPGHGFTPKFGTIIEFDVGYN
ncbi:HNH endonuclease [Vibrio phage 1.097.O._10N.286.49.B3]|uniref:VWA-like domain protein n=1 Tax=Vibrio phage 1.097.O._10N.286.49.B3 TaxID=1881383 RepID=A0A2I7R0P0_9CAUD|nr:HNH endonuclease [Vibrio phage 1.097.O._10N.286.49.B3]AUR87208.1 VWA-like domain protein [Vibrio phage 1.097.O._10N.286.49.B3]